ncbi:hypothetical protein [Streptomyces sp. HUAS TT7]
MIVRNPHLKVSAEVVGEHGSIPRGDFRADAVRECAAAHCPEVR